jgi:hypothetical protein
MCKFIKDNGNVSQTAAQTLAENVMLTKVLQDVMLFITSY